MGKINTTNYPNRPVSAYQDDDMFVLQDNGGETYTTNVGDIKDLIGEETAPELALKVDKNGTDRLMTAAEGTKLAGIAAGAQVNVLEGVVVDSVEQPISGKKAFIDLSGKTDLKVIADPFLDIMGYFKGAYVTYNGKLYEFTEEHTGAWNPSHVREIKAAGQFVRAGNGGYNTGDYSTTEGHSTRAEGEASHAEGTGTIANSDNQHVEGKYNIADTDDKYAHIVGNGTADNARSNALTLDWDGNLRISGDIADGNGDVTVEGNPVSFESPFEQDAKSVVVSVKPIQDLHGYDKPWAGGAGKNMIPMTVAGIKAANTLGTWSGNVYSIGTATIEILTDDGDNVRGIKVLGSVSENTPFFLYQGVISAFVDGSNYYIKDCALSDNISVTYADQTFTAQSYWIGNSLNIMIMLVGSQSYNNTYYPQIEVGQSATTFAPYSNICPISGIDEVEIGVSDGESEPTTTTIPLPSTLYGGTVDVENGEVSATMGYIASYNGETLPGAWISDCDEYTGSNSPTTGAEVAYELATPTTLSLTPTDVELLEGTNVLSTNGEKVAVTYRRSLWQDIDDLKTDTEGKLDKSDVADIEGDTASRAYSVNEFMLRADGLYKVTQPIAQNASITASNTEKTTIGAVLTALLNA